MPAEVKPIQIIRPLSVYVNGDKQADITSGIYKLDANRDAQITDGGYAGHSSGAKICSIDIKQIVGVTTTSFGILHRACLNDEYVEVAVPMESDVVNFIGVIKNVSADWDHKAGTAMGSQTFEGGQVQLA